MTFQGVQFGPAVLGNLVLGDSALGSAPLNPCGNFVVPTSFRQQLLNDLVNNFFSGSFLHLFQTPIVLTPAVTLAQMAAVECTFPFYGPVSVSPWTRAYLNSQGDAESDFTPVTYSLPTTIVPQNVWGYFLTFNGALLAVYQLPANPVVLQNVGDQVNVRGGVVLLDTSECCPLAG